MRIKGPVSWWRLDRTCDLISLFLAATNNKSQFYTDQKLNLICFTVFAENSGR